MGMGAALSTADLDLVLAGTKGLWDEVRGEHIFITGGTGFFGCWMVESFAYANRIEELGARATILTRDPSAFARKCPHLASNPAITLLSGDVRDFAFPDGRFKYVIHAATDSGGRQASTSSVEMLETILRGTERVLEFAASRETRKLLLTSSGAVYGSQPASISHLKEDFAGAPNPLDPSSAYSEGKRVAELMCAVHGATSGIECKIARCFAFTGPHLPLNAHFAIGNFIRDAIKGDVIMVNGDGTPKRSYMYAADLANWLWSILFRAPALEAFNVGSDESISILELAQKVVIALGSTATVKVGQMPIAGEPVKQYVPNTEKAQQQLGLKCRVSLEEAIRRTAAWHGYVAPTRQG
jgi:dTDP-glucose 4,6-dehydratase